MIWSAICRVDIIFLIQLRKQIISGIFYQHFIFQLNHILKVNRTKCGRVQYWTRNRPFLLPDVEIWRFLDYNPQLQEFRKNQQETFSFCCINGRKKIVTMILKTVYCSSDTHFQMLGIWILFWYFKWWK